MAFDVKNLTLLATGNGFQLWHYKTSDAFNTIDTADYFLAAKDMLRVRDVIYVDNGAAVGQTFVNANTGASVDVADITALTATDTR